MQKMSKILMGGIAGISAVVCVCGANGAAAPRSMANVSQTQASARGTTTARMPTMPTMSINTVGTHSVSGVDNNAGTPVPNPVNPDPTPTPTPTPTHCPDGGVVNSEFTVDMCMQSLLSCVQGGALPNGLNDMYNEDLRNSIINGMGLCATDIDKCIREVRVDCHKVYDSSNDVWLDFNSRVVQPEYYNFVLRKTGLTPNQAENVCGLLDKNTYGNSFTAVSAAGKVTSEYNKDVNAYNNNGGSKPNPVGATENTTANGNLTGVDGERGHYARWDATNAMCKVRVAAYNKDTLITNNWLFGAAGDNRTAEVWQDTGSTFTCNKKLFDFSLLNTTSTVAAVGLPGGALVGAGVGALTGHGAKAFDCNDEDMRVELLKQIKKDTSMRINLYLEDKIGVSEVADGDNPTFNAEKCNAIVELYQVYQRKKLAVDTCADTTGGNASCTLTMDAANIPADLKSVSLSCKTLDQDLRLEGNSLTVKGKVLQFTQAGDLEKVKKSVADAKECCLNRQPCSFRALIQGNQDLYCDNGTMGGCQNKTEAKREINQLNDVFGKLEILQGQKSTVGKNALIGGAIGLGTAGVATAITAFVERNNISCRVGDGLETVGFNKSYTISPLKDFYVKWNLRVADSISPTAKVTSCQDWIDTCGMYTTAEECKAVVINYQKPGRNTTVSVRGACRMAGSVCIENRPVAVSYGACDRNGLIPAPVVPANSGANSVTLIAH